MSSFCNKLKKVVKKMYAMHTYHAKEMSNGIKRRQGNLAAFVPLHSAHTKSYHL